MSRRRKREAARGALQTPDRSQMPPPAARPWWVGWPAALIGGAVLLAAALIALGMGARRALAPAAAPTLEPAIGNVMGCQQLPAFTDRLGYTNRLAISTSERTYDGLVIFDGQVSLDAPLEQRDIYQDPSWASAGTLGPFVRDAAGNIFTAPVPRTALGDIPAGSQNTIYRVDTNSAAMTPFLTLPDSPEASAANPFGILGLTYDCESNALYVSTVAGSTSGEERGRILRVDLATQAVTEQVTGVDAIGLGVFRGDEGKRLYFGLAREPALASVALDANGDATGEIRDELSVADAGGGIGEPRVRRVNFTGTSTMVLFVVPFNFNLRAVSEQQQVVLRYEYDPASGGWARAAAP